MRSWKPSLEGSLAIFNVVSLLAFVVMRETLESATLPRALEAVIIIWLWALSLPISALCVVVLKESGVQLGTAIVLVCIAAGVNAIVWGRCVAWVLRRTLLARFAQAADEDDQRGAASGEDPPHR